jgi:hypothetical protein
MEEKNNDLPPFREDYKLTDDQKVLIERFRKELAARLHTKVSIEPFVENYLAYPIPRERIIHLEIHAGNYNKIATISAYEIKDRHVFYYFLR